MRYIEILTERESGNRYIFTSVPLDKHLEKGKKYSSPWDTALTTGLYTRSKKALGGYKRSLASSTAHHPGNNYIYVLPSVKIFDWSNFNDFRNFFDNAIPDVAKWAANINDSYSAKRAKTFITSTNAKEIHQLLLSFKERDMLKTIFEYADIDWLSKNYMGRGDKFGDAYIFNLTYVLQNAKLIDGNALRFTKEAPEKEFEPFPELVEASLKAFIDDPKRRLGKDVKEWLKENSPKKYDKVKIYRTVGFTFNKDNYVGAYDDEKYTPEAIDKILKRRLNVTLDDTVIGNKAIVRRGKESSWSTDPVVARNFATGVASKALNFLLIAEVPAQQVVIDFTQLPLDYRKQFEYWTQNEVIVDGIVPSIINDVWVDKAFLNQFLKRFDYDFKRQHGIVKGKANK